MRTKSCILRWIRKLKTAGISAPKGRAARSFPMQPNTRKEVFPMLTVRGIITLLVLVVLFALAVVWISKHGGWKDQGCGGNCASCHQRCENPKEKKDS